MPSSIWVYAICWNEAQMLPFFLKHYSTFAEKIIIWDEHSTDGSREIIQACPIAELRDWPYAGLDDARFLEAVNDWWKYSTADWIMWPDIDELLYCHNMATMLANTEASVIPATGYALISTTGFPTDTTKQLYEQVTTGLRQENYDKRIIWKRAANIEHTIGRHTYGNDWPKFQGNLSPDVGVKLFHCHHVGGINYTSVRNKRNYDRAINKKYAWNYQPGQTGVGTETWVAESITNLIQVTSLKLHLGSGGYELPGWQNYDLDLDIRRKLPFKDNCASHIFIEHCVEHITHQQAWNFFEECYRVLISGGILRVTIPDLAKLFKEVTPAYCQAVKAGGHGDGSKKSAIKAAIFEHGHQAAWTAELLNVMLSAVGFKPRFAVVGISIDPSLDNIEQHGKTVGTEINLVESSVVEAIK